MYVMFSLDAYEQIRKSLELPEKSREYQTNMHSFEKHKKSKYHKSGGISGMLISFLIIHILSSL